MTPIQYLNGLGVVAEGNRKIFDGKEFDKFFKKPIFADPYLSYAGTTHDTLNFMSDIIKKTLADTKRIAPLFRGKSLEDTCGKIFNFIYNHIQYKPDSRHAEQLRRPARAWHDRKTGVDCDCYSIFIGSILSNLRIPFALRMVKIKNRDYFQHVYVVVPKNGTQNALNNADNYITIDPVLDTFNEEYPFTEKQDNFMRPIRYLNGSVNGLNGLEQTKQTNNYDLLGDIFGGLLNENPHYIDGLDGWGFLSKGLNVLKRVGGRILHGKQGGKGGIVGFFRRRKALRQARRLKRLNAQNVSPNFVREPNMTPITPIPAQVQPTGGGVPYGGGFLRNNSGALINAATMLGMSAITGQPTPMGMGMMAPAMGMMNPNNGTNNYWQNKSIDAQIEANKGVSNGEAMRIAKLTAEAEAGKIAMRQQQTRAGLGGNIDVKTLLFGSVIAGTLFTMIKVAKQ